MERQHFDVVIVGGGLAGASLALALAPLGLRLALVEGQALAQSWPPLEESVWDYDPRVSALTESSRQFLENLGTWQAIADSRVCAYGDMDVWDAEGTGRIHFSAAEVQRSALGHIVENRLITASLLKSLQETGVALYFGTAVQGLNNGGGRAELLLADGRCLGATLIAAADGAQSRVRQWAGFDMREWDYHHHAIACTVECERPHRATAWQRFLPEGPLAFLPLADRDQHQRYCSIVWSARPELSDRLMAEDDAAFCRSLGAAFEHRLGEVVAVGRRFNFPLRQRHARDYVRGAVVLLGDAAHSIHPLAGQGINLGFADAAVLAEEVGRAVRLGLSVADPSVLARYQRRRKGDNLAMMAMMEGFQNLFESGSMPLRLLRNTGMSWLDRAVPLKRQVIARAMGL